MGYLYVLILTMSNPNGGVSVTSVEVRGKAVCESIGNAWVQQNNDRSLGARYLCAPGN